jgi:AcrR family transcriptional regulator
MPRKADPALRRALIERAAEMLARREPVTLRSVVEGTGASTMAVYTHFDGMVGLWRAVRQEGFTRLGERLATVRATADPVRDLAALGAAYLLNALEHPTLYRAMFDATVELDDPAAADATFAPVITAAARARTQGRFDPAADPHALAIRYWATGHGLTMLVLTGVLPREALSAHGPEVAYALFVAAGDDPARARRSVRNGWRAMNRDTAGRRHL